MSQQVVNPGFGEGGADDEKPPQAPKKKEEEGIVSKLTSWMESPTAITIIACVSIVMSIISISTAVSAYSTLNSRASDFRSLVDSWDRPPMTAMTLPNPSTGACAADEVALFNPTDRLTWPGTSSGYCACPIAALARDFESKTSSCNSTEEAAGCRTDPSIGPITLLWQGEPAFCVRRDASSRLYRENGVGPRKKRPAPTAPGVCPTGWKACGPGLYNNDGSICVRTSETCPITRIDRLTAAEWAARSGEYNGSVELGGGGFGDTYYLAYAQASPGASSAGLYLPYMPFSEGQPSLYSEVCIGGKRFWYERSGSATGGSGPSRDARSCGKPGADSRWFAIDSTTDGGSTGLLEANFDLNVRCTGPNRNVSEVSVACASSDSICNEVVSVGRCDKLLKFAASGTGETVGFMARKEVFWASGCDVDPIFLADRVAPTDKAVDAMLTVMIINIICNVITIGFAIYIIIMVCTSEDEDGDGNIDNEVKAKYATIKWGKTIVLGLMGLGKIIPMAVVLGGILALKADFETVKETGCGDSEANSTISFLEKTLDGAYTNAIISFVSDGFSLLYALYLLVAMLLGCGGEEKKE